MPQLQEHVPSNGQDVFRLTFVLLADLLAVRKCSYKLARMSIVRELVYSSKDLWPPITGIPGLIVLDLIDQQIWTSS